MTRRIHITVFVAVLAAFWAVLLLFQGLTLTPGMWRPFSLVSAAALLLVSGFELWIWRWGWLHPWFVRSPVLQGLWRGALRSNWVNPETGQAPQPIEAFLAIHQSFSTIRIRLMTAESSSELMSGALVTAGEGTHEVVGVYRNTPRILVRQRSPIHHGAVILRLAPGKPPKLEGEYWTDRDTKGEMSFQLVAASSASSFEEARNHSDRLGL